MTIAQATSFGRYRVIRELGRGGEAVVHLAEDPVLKRLVAIKCFPFATAVDEKGGHETFRREAEALSRLDHPGICRIHDTGVEDGIPFIAMSYVAGDTLDRHAGIEWPEAVRIAEDVARIVAAAHAAGIVHGDLKPQNIAVAPEGGCFVLDFGVARFLDDTLHSMASARPAGTLPYLAPECVVRAPDQRSDVYGLGAVLFELVTGRAPHEAPTRAALLQIILREEAPLARDVAPGVTRDVEAVLARALARDPERRYPAMAGFASDLGCLRCGEPPAARRIGALGRVARTVRRRPAAAALVTFAAAFFVVAATVAVVKNRRLERYLESARIESARSVAEATAAQAHVERHARLADFRRLEDLERRAQELVPPSPSLVPALRGWEEAAHALAGKIDGHRQALSDLLVRSSGATTRLGATVSRATRRRIERLRERHSRLLAAAAGEGAAESRRVVAERDLRAYLDRLESALPHVEARSYENPADAWHDATLTAVVEGLDRLAGPTGTMRDVSRRIDDSARLDRWRTEHREAWEQACRDIRDEERCPRYRGLSIEPQLGLMPLRRNAETGLWEFLHLPSGEAPGDLSASRIQVGPDTGVVLVLLPGAISRMGARVPGDGDPPDAPHVDPHAMLPESPIDDVPLDPFFISKFEMTEGQWFRSLGKPGGPARDTGALPVTAIDWNEAARVLTRVGLELPTEAQWEYAARAGTTSPWWTGADPASLSGAECFRGAAIAAVGSFRSNAFGLHDVAGNVSEWCRDQGLRYESPHAPGSGERVSLDQWELRAWRGGSHGWSAIGLRSARRNSDSPNMRRPDLGIRPARRVFR